MDHSLLYNRMCGYGSDDEGPEEDLEDGFMVQENQFFKEMHGGKEDPHYFVILALPTMPLLMVACDWGWLNQHCRGKVTTDVLAEGLSRGAITTRLA